MDERIDILTSTGQLTGKTCLKSEAHQKGLYHQTVHIWFYTDTKKILLQKRAAVKKVFPNHWDVSVAGHMGAGEKTITFSGDTTYLDAMIEFAKESDVLVHEAMLSSGIDLLWHKPKQETSNYANIWWRLIRLPPKPAL